MQKIHRSFLVVGFILSVRLSFVQSDPGRVNIHSPDGPARFSATPTSPADFDPSRLIVRFAPSSDAGERAGALELASVKKVLRNYSAVEGLKLVQVEPAHLQDAVQSLRRNPNVLYAELDQILHIEAVPNDTDFDILWGMHNVGQDILGVAGVAGADIDAASAWDVWTGASGLRIAVIDTGVDYTHPDLLSNMWTNPYEIPGNGIDDDGNGYVDDVHGYNFVDDIGDPMDVQGHGTHVAGTIGAVANNELGVAGVNWHCQIVALRVGTATGEIYSSAAIAAMQYAIDTKIRVSNNSWGGYFYSQARRDMIEALQAVDHVFVAAAGNDAVDTDSVPHYPAAYDLDNIISVAAINNLDELAYFSNFGQVTIDLGAPGLDVYSTLPGGAYGFKSGTSMATPHVTGVTALVMSRYPGLNYMQVRDRVLQTTRPTAALAGITVTGGVVNAAAALQDCNANGVQDDQDIALGTSADCTGNGIPDECEGDCNLNGVADSCDILTGSSEDCLNNGVPDECELFDCNGNGIPDACDLANGTSENCNGNQIPDECEPQLDCNLNGIKDYCDLAAGTSDDCDGNQTPDECEYSSDDCNANGLRDGCELAAGLALDCNGNDRLDICDINDGILTDSNGNGIADVCGGACCSCDDRASGDILCQITNNDDECNSTIDGHAEEFFGGGTTCDVCSAPRPPDVCSEATELPSRDRLAIPFYRSCTSDSTPELPISCLDPLVSRIANDLWYTYTVPCTGDVTISLCGDDPEAESVMAVYRTGDSCTCPLSTQDEIGCADDVCGKAAQVVVSATAGQCLTIRLGNVTGRPGQHTVQQDVLKIAVDPRCPVSGPCSEGTRHDDGHSESSLGTALGESVSLVERFTPPVYPYHYNSTCVELRCSYCDLPITRSVEIVAYDDDGPNGMPGTLLGSVESEPLQIGPERSFHTITLNGHLPPATGFNVYQGSIYLGVRLTRENGEEAALLGLDGTTTTSLTPYIARNDGTWEGQPAEFDAMIRADGETLVDNDGDGVPDDFDLCPGGNDLADGDADSVPDDCDRCPGSDDTVDTDGDGLPDDCDICDNRYPETCTFASPILAAPPHDILKNRYISIDPRGADAINVGVGIDIRVGLTSTLVSGVTAVGSNWWADAPDENCISLVRATRPAMPPNFDRCPVTHLTGCPIIPTSTYDISAVVGGVLSEPPLAAATQTKPGAKWFGDAVGFFDGSTNAWTPPQGVTNIDDAVAAIKTWQNPGGVNATHVSVTDVHPNLNGTQINRTVNFDDVFSFILAFQGNEYPGPDVMHCTDP